MRDGALVLLAAALAALALVGPGTPAWADGALAVGSTGDVVRHGIAFGTAVDLPEEQAKQTAVRHCRTFRARAAAEQCKVVTTFAGECYAIAYDPQPGTPGAGWGIGADQLAANRKAIAMCEQSAGSARKGYCQVERGGCDTTGRREGRREAPKASPQAPPQVPAGSGAEETRLVPPAQRPPPTAAPRPKTPQIIGAKAARNRSPLLPIGALAGVGAAYALGQRARGKVKGGLAEGQILVGSALAVASAVLVAILDIAGAQPTLAILLAGLVALAAALFT